MKYVKRAGTLPCIATVLALALSASAGAPAFAQSQVSKPSAAQQVADLQLQRSVARAEWLQARATKSRLRKDLTAARSALRLEQERIQQIAASVWMGIPIDAPIDEDRAYSLRYDLAAAINALAFAEVDVTTTRRHLDSLESKLLKAKRAARAERDQAVASARERQPQQSQQTVRISCPVAQPSAVYADFGAPRPGGPHKGIDLPATHGMPVLAAWTTVVKQIETGGWMGKGIILEDGAGNTWWYAHLSQIDVEVGQVVAWGQPIGLVGSTGNSTGPHLHFEVHARGLTPVDPYSLVSPACGMGDPMGPEGRVSYEASTDEAN